MEKGAVVSGRQSRSRRRRALISCTECHRRKQKCDRCQPCQNCVKRGKLDLCRYESNGDRTCNLTAAGTSLAGPGESSIRPSAPSADMQLLSKPNQLSPQDHRHFVDTLGYSTHNVHNTLGLANKIGAEHSSTSTTREPADVSNRNQTYLDDKYRSLVRQLPSREYVDTLVHQFFSEINWQYDVLDEITFHQQLENWRSLPYSAHSRGISSLPPEILVLPSLIFQLMAHSLTHRSVGEHTDPSLESLKFASGMTFVDLARDFSEAGYSIIQFMEKKDISVVAVQSGILRASFLKNTGSVIEAWHVVGTTVRNAQEIGLHASMVAQNLLLSTDAQWDHEMRRRIWFVLQNWDIHMAVVLGRPITTIMAAETVDPPDDLAQRESGKLPRRRTDHDAPTPFSVIRAGYNIAYRHFPRVRELENRGAQMEDYYLVRETHAAIERNIGLMPRWCHHDDPDLRFDEFASCHWLPAARQSLTSGIHFVLLSLHRPYIFKASESRTEALEAARMVFAAQRRLFLLSEPKQYLAFNMVYPLFDAMVITLAILVLFPNQDRDVHCRSIENVHWGIDVLAQVGRHNAMARSANSVVSALLSRLERGPGSSLQHSNHGSEEGGAIERLGSGTVNPRAPETSLITGSTTDNFGAPDPADSSSPSYHRTWSTALTPLDFSDKTLSPPRPICDLFYQDVYEPVPEAFEGAEHPAAPLQINGNYSDDSFWSFVNDLGHA